MQNAPILKFEKSTNYLNSQLNIQTNNKQLVLDIIANISVISNNASFENKQHYEEILEKANLFLQTISDNIISIDQLNLEISNITNELSSLLSKNDRTSKSKEFYIAAFSNVKYNITQYTEKFQNLERKLDFDNAEFNDFINESNFQYNYTESSENSYEYSGFSIDNNKTEEDLVNETVIENIIENDIVEPIISDFVFDEVQENIEDVVSDEVSENVEDIISDEILENVEDVVSDEVSENVEDVISDEILENVEDVVSDEISENVENIVEDVIENSNNTVEEIATDITKDIAEDISENIALENNDVDEAILEELIEESIENDIVEPIISDVVSDEVQENIEDVVSDEVSENVEDVISDEILENVEDVVSDEISENVENIVEDVIENSNNTVEEIATDITEDIAEDISENIALENNDVDEAILEELIEESIENDIVEPIISDIASNEVQENIEDVVSDEVQENVEDVVSDEVSENVENIINVEDEFTIEPASSDNVEVLEEIVKQVEDLKSEKEQEIDKLTNEFRELLTQLYNEDFVNDIPLTESSTIENSESTEIIDDIIKKIETEEFEGFEGFDIQDDIKFDPTKSSSKVIVEDIIKEVEETNIQDIVEDTISEEVTKISNNSNDLVMEKIINDIISATSNNTTLVISDKRNKIYLPYTIEELENYLKYYPNFYTTLTDVVEQEFTLPFVPFLVHSNRSRFSETYNLIKNREGRSKIVAFGYALKLAGKRNLNPAIIAACKTQHELESYLENLKNDTLDKFKYFKILYEINPL